MRNRNGRDGRIAYLTVVALVAALIFEEASGGSDERVRLVLIAAVLFIALTAMGASFKGSVGSLLRLEAERRQSSDEDDDEPDANDPKEDTP